MPHVTEIFRHPLKSHGREALAEVTLSQGAAMPWDRRWAVAHEISKADGQEWAACANFSRVAKAPQLMAITARLNEADQSLTLSHPNRKDFTFQPDDERQLSGFLAWVKPLMPADRAQSARILRLAERGFTDTDFPSISINSHASLRALSEHMGQPLSPHRWRGNLWIDGLEPWVEHSWLGQKFRIGGVVFEGVEPIVRCLATTANPDTGLRDADTLGALNALSGHQDFGLYARVIEPGTLSLDDTLELL
jgi:uncharacterized protein YcbX